MKMTKKKTLIGVVIIIVIAIVVINLASGGKKLTPIQAEPVGRKGITEEVSASGWIQPKTRVNITAEVNAKILAVFVKDGESVTRGQILLQLDTVQLQKDVEQYRFSLNELKARKEASHSGYLQAEEEYNRQRQLYEKKLTSETLLKNAEYAYLSSKYNYEAMGNQYSQGQAVYEKALDNLAKTTLKAPMDGVITYIDAEAGEVAQAQTSFTQGKSLMTISNLNTFEVEVDVDETEIAKIKRGQSTKIGVDAFPDSTFQGEVVEIGNTALQGNIGTTEQTTNFKVKILFKETGVEIRPGMSATVDIITNTRTDALTVPYGAIVMRPPVTDSLKVGAKDSSGIQATSTESTAGETQDKKTKDQKGVFVIKDSKAKFISVETGIADQKNIEITSGVTAKDSVITGPFKTLRMLKDGEGIKVEKQFKIGVSN